MVFFLRPLKLFILFIIGSFRRALCCIRISRHSFNQEECLTHIGIVPNNTGEITNWNNSWNDEELHERRPQTIQDHIQLYRDRISQPPPVNEEDNKVKDLFQELEPRVIQQRKVIIQSNEVSLKQPKAPDLSRLAVSNSYTESSLGDWVEDISTGWDEQHLDPSDILRQQKRIQRELRQHSLGKKLNT